MSKRLIYVIGGFGSCHGYSNWLDGDLTTSMEESSLCLGLGGSDVQAKYYNQPDSGHLSCSPETDKREYQDYKRAIKLGKKIYTTCKGLQWGSALAGGAIFQHVNHPYHHTIKTFDGKTLPVNSLHHNLCDLSKLKENEDYKLLAWTKLSKVHIDGYGNDIPCEKEPEGVYFPKINLLGFQNHPELQNNNPQFEETMNWHREVLEKFLADKL